MCDKFLYKPFVGESPQVQPAACERSQVPGGAVQLPHAGVGRRLQDTLLLHHLRRRYGW